MSFEAFIVGVSGWQMRDDKSAFLLFFNALQAKDGIDLRTA